MLQRPSLASLPFVFKWNKWLPLKVNIFGWRMSLNRLPTKECLIKRKIQIINDLCPLCMEFTETLDHIFTTCHCAQKIWSLISSWINLPHVMPFYIIDILKFHEGIKGSSNFVTAVQSVMLLACWALWKHRNSIVFNGKKLNIQGIMEEVKVLGFLWLKSRVKSLNLKEDQWDSVNIL
ncbi:putative reverse transcriptase zinc-binding domain-containing protein [Helianthus annuus]|nr:putative reverse transcriptase zinc-binding domain-containing protein [Helianthus annuus]